MEVKDAIILISAAIIFSLLSCSYMNLYEVKRYNLTDTIRIKNVLVPVSIKRMIYELIEVVSLIAIGIELRYFFPNDEYVHQIKLVFLISVLFALAFIDYRYRIVPNRIIIFCLIARIPFFIFEFIFERNYFFQILKDILLGILIIGIIMAVLYLITKGGIGMGDIKLFMVIILYQGLTNSMMSIMMSMIVCFIASVVLLMLKKKKVKDTLPLVPCILIGTYISIALIGM